MASSSSSYIPKSFKYDVFLSFRGEDTRNNFVGHLYEALQRNCIETYKDDQKIEKGERINDQLLKSIEESRFYIIIFSKNYASSSWCLDELVKIMECQKMTEHTAFPVFYDAEPNQVRKQNGVVKEAFAEHEKKEAAGKWRDAMKGLADLAGWELKATANGGEDTRNNFVGLLYKALEAKCIETYKDDEKIEKGERINDQLLKSIEESRFFIIIFSKTYASSSWCLDELVKIIECQKKIVEQTAYPVFFDVEPTHVRKQNGPVGEAFSKHENEEAARKWREAMKEASNLAGWELKATPNGDESKSIQIIVDAVFKKLHSTNSRVDEKLVGMDTRITDVLSSLEIGTEGVRMIGIKGMGGGGKTTLARAVYDQISNHFEGKSFVENVREVSKPSLSGLKKLQKRILKDVLNKTDITFSSVHDGKNMLKDMMSRRKTLVVLDDVDCIEQLEALAGEPNWFKSGSRLIITTRDEQVLLAHRVNFVHDVNLLSSTEAICLFSKYAFGRENPTRGYEELSGQVVQYAHGLPLTIKVLSSFLCDQKEPEWIDAIKRLKTIPLKATMERLELNYNGLEDDYKEIFLDVACILKGWGKEKAIIALESRGFRARIGLRVLEQKSLITISKYEVLGMHDHLEEMGRNIVRRSHPDEPNKHSRLWIREEIEHILTNDLGARETKCLRFSSPGFSAEIAIKGLTKLKDLRFIHIRREKENNLLNLTFDIVQLLEFDKVSQYLPNSLQFMRWYYFPFSSLPNTFQGENLVGLEMGGSKIVQLWKDAEEKVLHKLRFLTIWKSKLKTFDLKLAPNLEQLTICSCYDFRELHIPADHHSKLERLDLKYCHNLVEFQMPSESLKLEHLDLSLSKLKTIHLGSTPNLKKLILQGCNGLVLLPELGRVKYLKELNIKGTGIRRLPQRIFQLKGLRIIASTEILESCGLTSKIQTSRNGTFFEETFCYI